MTSPYPQPKTMPEGASFADGVWTQSLSLRSLTEGRAALFLDRDGVVVEDAHYLHDPDKVRLTPNAAETIRTANDLGIPVILVTNQAGIGYGYFGWDDFVAVQARIVSELGQGGAHIDGVFACPFHAKAKPPYVHLDHPARKPNPGMLLAARELMGVVLENSWIVGDRALDVMAGRNAGLSGGVHVLTGHGSTPGERDAAVAVATENYRVETADNLSQSLDLIEILKS